MKIGGKEKKCRIEDDELICEDEEEKTEDKKEKKAEKKEKKKEPKMSERCEVLFDKQSNQRVQVCTKDGQTSSVKLISAEFSKNDED